MKPTGLALLTTVFILLSPTICSQPNSAETVPMDPLIRYGKLDNGITYYIRQNSEPEKRASFYIIQNVGSLLEEDNQKGLAHFLEHMAFNGTRHFPGKGIINTLEKHGVAFGSNINAFTSYDETVYNLSDVPVDHPGLVDTCLLILNDWSNYLLLTGEEIDAERGVITEEWRTRRNATARMIEEFMPVLLWGSKYPERDVIGDMDIIQNFKPDLLRDFYQKWYRTDLQAIAIVGDFDPEEMEKKVQSLFSKIPPFMNPPERKFYEVPDHDELLYILATDKEAGQNSIDLYIKRRAVDPERKTMDYLREQYVTTLFNSMMSRRIGELLQKGTPPFISGSVYYSSFVRGYDVFTIGAQPKKNEGPLAFEAIYTEAERIRRYGFTSGEFERAKSNLLTSWESYYKQRDKINNDTYAGNIRQHFLINEPLPSVEFEYEAIKAKLPGITLGEVSEKARDWMTDKNRVIVVQGAEEEDAEHLTEEMAREIISRISSAEIEPYVDISAGTSLINEGIHGGQVVNIKTLEQFGAVEWLLSNGARVIFRKADYEKDNITLSAYSFGGSSLVDDHLVPEIDMLATLASTYGAGDYDIITLQKMLTGKKASLNISIGELTENLSGSSTPGDFETMLQLLYLKFERPRFDSEAHNALMERYLAFMTSLNNNPQKVIQDSLTLILSDYHPRARVMNTEYLKDIEFEEIVRLYKSRIRDADDFVFFIVGNIDEADARPLIEKYIGSLSSFDGSERWIDRNVEGPEGITRKVIELPLTVPKATVVIGFDNHFPYTAYNRQALRVINGILDIAYNETIREEEGGTYGVSISISPQQYPKEEANAMIIFECDPERADNLKKIVYEQIDKLKSAGPTLEHLEKAVSNVLKNREESKSHNSYWLSALYTYYYNGIDYNDPANYEDILNGFTIEDIRKAANELFGDADLVELIFKSGKE